MRIAIAQINATVGDLKGNVERILDFAARARNGGAQLMLTPELALCGYPPEDLLLREDFYLDCERALEDLAQRLKGIAAVIGHPRQVDGRRYNAASVVSDGRIQATYHKYSLPNHTVFDEQRYFDSDDAPCVLRFGGAGFGINICEDIWGKSSAQASAPDAARDAPDMGVNICADSWQAPAPRAAREAGAQVLLVLNASPYHVRKQAARYDVMRRRAAENGMALIYCNMVGGQDELVFDGASFALNTRGEVTLQMPGFVEALGYVDVRDGDTVAGEVRPPRELEADVYDALCLGVRDYISKNGFKGAVLGLSGGIDSALTLAIAADALGADKVRAVMMPSRHTAAMSLEDARAEAVALGVRYDEIPIEPMFGSFTASLSGPFAGRPADVTEENLQSRVRGVLLMALSNKFGDIVLTTGNKSEMATGYSTLYGDMAGGFAVLKDVSKTLVYRLSAYRNRISPVIPERVITRAPSAELRDGQTDQDSLPPYDVLDAIMEAYVERNLAPDDIERAGYARADIERVLHLLRVSEYKRHQAPVGPRITPRGFGKDWRYPITNRYRHGYS